MNKRLFCFIISIIFVIKTSCAQSQAVTEMSSAVIELTGSFFENPYHHSNTLKINDLTKKFKSTLDEMYRQVPIEARTDFNLIQNMRKIVKCLDFTVASIAGYSRGGIDATEWESAIHPIMTSFGWSWKIIHSTPDVVFYEYTKDQFIMVLAKNIRPKKDDGDYNANSFICYTWEPRFKKNIENGGRIVFGGNYVFVSFGDDENVYKKITKVSSKRGNAF